MDWITGSESPARFLFFMVLSLFLIEALVMGVLHHLHASPLTEALIDSVLLVIFLSPMLYYFLFRPLLRQINERKRTEESLLDSERQLRRLSSQLLSVQEQERRRISRELHDELGQALTLMKLQVRTVQDGLRADQVELRDECGHILRYLEQVIDDVRRLSRDLCPAALEHQGLTAALRQLVGNFARTFGTNVDFDAGSGDLDRLFAREACTHIYRTVQEALTNVGKHSEAGTASIKVSISDGKAQFVISDDGRGFDAKRESMRDHAERGMGLPAMEERVRMLGGDFAVWSEKGKGSRITFTVPETGVKKETA